MPKKRINQPAPSGRAALRLAKNPIRSSRAVAKSAPRGLSIRSKVLAGFVLVTLLIATTAILAQHGKQKRTEGKPTERVHDASLLTQSNGPQSGEMSPESLTSPSLWSKEYIHGPGGRIVATEERLKFLDVADDSQFFEDIYRIAARGVTVGCPAPNYCPEANVTRGQMAAFIMRALGEFNPPTPPSQRFADVLPTNTFYNFIDRLAVLGITVGCGGNNYCPDDPVKHEQMAAFMNRAIGVPNPPTPPTQPTFCDVPTTNTFYAHIEYYANSRNPIIWPGCDGVGTCPTGPGAVTCNSNCTTGRCFCPCRNVTRREMAHILVKAFGI